MDQSIARFTETGIARSTLNFRVSNLTPVTAGWRLRLEDGAFEFLSSGKLLQ